VLISVGVLMFAFVAYQLWGTGIQTAQAQQRLADEFESQLSSAPGTTVLDPVVTTVPDGSPNRLPDSTTLPPPIVSTPPTGDPVARLDIPAIGIDGKIVLEGITPDDLTQGPGHFPETPLPGQYGNAAIAGHRTTHGQPFYRIDELAPGDDIVVTTLAGRYTYVVTGTVIVGPDDYAQVIPTTDPTRATLVLTSCHPRFSARQRIVVAADLDPSRSDVVTLGTGAQVLDATDGATIATIATIPPDTTIAPVTTIGETLDTSSATVPTTVPPTVQSSVPATVPATVPAAIGSGGGTTGAELFENRWFSDPDAFGGVALWGIALTAVALLAWQLSRRVGRNWVGALVGFVPFIVTLYFFFENVNRLLPPNL
jgi:sortase A